MSEYTIALATQPMRPEQKRPHHNHITKAFRTLTEACLELCLVRTLQRHNTMQQKVEGDGRCTLLPRDSALSPDVGHMYGIVGYIDFYLGAPSFWAFELLRDGDRIKHHVDRYAS